MARRGYPEPTSRLQPKRRRLPEVVIVPANEKSACRIGITAQVGLAKAIDPRGLVCRLLLHFLLAYLIVLACYNQFGPGDNVFPFLYAQVLALNVLTIPSIVRVNVQG